MKRHILCAALFVCGTGSSCVTNEPKSEPIQVSHELKPDSKSLARWTKSLRDQQPEDAFAAVYRVRGRYLIFVAAVHENRTESATFRMVRDAYDGFNIDTVIAEGYPTSKGMNPQGLMVYASEQAREGFQEGGETVPTVAGAVREGAGVWGGEPDNANILARVVAEGFSVADVLGYYVLRVIPQWERERKILNAADPQLRALVDAQIRRARGELQIDAAVLPDYESWAAWYEGLNGKSIAAGLAVEEVGPLHDGSYGTNRIAAAISRARDSYLHELMIGHLNAGETVLVVFGGSHLMIQRPALDRALGPPCYVGQILSDAPRRCRS